MDIRVALDAIVDVQKSQYAGVSSSVIILYDHVLTLDREIQLVWFESWSIGKVLFLACRYYWTFAAIFNDYALMSSWHKSEPFCDFWISWQGWTTVFVAGALTEVILLLRIRALYAGDRRLTVPLLAGLIVTMTICGTIMGKSLHEKTTLFIVAGPHVFCAFGNIPPYLSAFFLPLMAFESLLGGLAIYKWIKEVGVTLASPRIAPALLRVLVRDSVIYFIVMTLSYVVTAVVWFEAPTLVDLPGGFLSAFSCVMGNRLILNLRSQAQRRRQTTLSETDKISNLLSSLHSEHIWQPHRNAGGSNTGSMEV